MAIPGTTTRPHLSRPPARATRGAACLRSRTDDPHCLLTAPHREVHDAPMDAAHRELNSTKFELANLRVAGQLVDKLNEWRLAGWSDPDIAFQLRLDYNVNVSASTVGRWCQSLGIERRAS